MPSESKLRPQIERDFKKPLPEILRELYNGSQSEVARKLGTTQGTVSRWMRRYKLTTSRVINSQDDNAA